MNYEERLYEELSHLRGFYKFELVRIICETTASQGKTITYGQVGRIIGQSVGRMDFSKILNELMKYDIKNGRPLFSSCIVNAEKEMPGIGYFDQLKELGLPYSKQDWENQFKDCVEYMKKIATNKAA